MKTQIIALSLLLAMTAEPALAANKISKCKVQGKLQQQPEAAWIGTQRGRLQPIPLNAAYSSDRSLRKQVLIESVHARRTVTNSVEVATRFVNCTRRPVRLLVRTHFMDGAQFLAEPITQWQTLILQPNSFGSYRTLSTSIADIALFLVEYRGDQS